MISTSNQPRLIILRGLYFWGGDAYSKNVKNQDEAYYEIQKWVTDEFRCASLEGNTIYFKNLKRTNPLKGKECGINPNVLSFLYATPTTIHPNLFIIRKLDFFGGDIDNKVADSLQNAITI